MSSILIIIVGVLYGIVSIDSIRKGDLATSVIFGGYALSNIGLYMVAK